MIVSTKELGELIGITTRHIYSLEKIEVFKKEDKDAWDVALNFQSYIKYKTDNVDEGSDLGKVRLEKEKIEKKLKEIQYQEKISELISIEKVAKELEDIAITISNKLYGIPHHLKRRLHLDNQLINALETEIENTLKELKDPEIYHQKALEVQENREKEREESRERDTDNQPNNQTDKENENE
ncbi:hypothetical protein BKH41_03880 [Helicobacter sp. 12S02232-10]|uniref:hypothetical protein n=1 Tax=Helicobacter sp. 12S02232-10 TaxID=1476197 RepID=UPI000BA5C119|nr:hypothetical protein [Helicobacter sp. 12S02232-10]PAF49228.1 hypothetical protein BKH41_03880 [Helicobacter sp. 12S02232-10]